MKQVLLIALISFSFSIAGNAQLGGLINKAKNKVQQRVDKKVDNEMDKTLDKAEGKNTEPTDAPAANKSETSTKEEENTLKAYSRFDFIPGDSILYSEDFQQEAIGELPANWNTSGSGEITLLDKYPGQWLRLHKQFVYLTANQKQFGENYTVEFDLILQLKNNGWMYPDLEFTLFSSKDDNPSANSFLKGFEKYEAVTAALYPGEGNSRLRLQSVLDGKGYFHGDPKTQDALHKSFGTPIHIAIQVQKERYRMWINQDKVFDIPKAVPANYVMNQLLFQVGSTNYPENQYGVFIGNIKVATGKPDTRHKLLEEGKFSTTGILFDFQSAVIKPESYAVAKEIATLLKENGSLQLKVIGHTSSDGDDKANMELSKKRAAAVKDLLVAEFGIEEARLVTEGKGETQPIADNKTKEGKTANRRVEFIKL